VTPRAPQERLRREERLRRRPDFLTVQETGRRYPGRHYLLLCRARDSGPKGPARLGITVSKKVGTAVVRNQVKRWVRESYRRAKAAAPDGVDFVVIARPSAAEAGYQGTAEELRGLLRRSRAR
jgi:ribonuclease P protein component